MKLRALFFCMIAAMTICSCSKKQNDVISNEACGNVKSIKTTGYKATEKFGEVSEGEVIYDANLFLFNENGYITEISCFDYSGDLVIKSVYAYGSNNNVNKINRYDGDGDEIERVIYTYNDDGNATKIVEYDKSGKVNYTRKNEWDGDKCIKEEYISEYSTGEYHINEFKGGSLVKSVSYDKNGKKTGRYAEYENDKITKIVTPDYTITVTYNKKGLCTSIVNGQYLTNTILWREGESYIYEYEYDKKGNWIRKVEYQKKSKKAERIFVREIEYY